MCLTTLNAQIGKEQSSKTNDIIFYQKTSESEEQSTLATKQKEGYHKDKNRYKKNRK